MQARVEVEVGFVGRVRPAKDSSEVAAGGHAESLDKITRRPVVLLLHKNATAVGQHEGARTYPLGWGERASKGVAGLASGSARPSNAAVACDSLPPPAASRPPVPGA
jgi:hypothetical protein